MCPAKTQISLGICPVWSESSMCAQWVAKDPRFLHADNEDSDQTGRMPRLIWVFAGRTLILLVLSCRSSFETVVKNTIKSLVFLFSLTLSRLTSCYHGDYWSAEGRAADVLYISQVEGRVPRSTLSGPCLLHHRVLKETKILISDKHTFSLLFCFAYCSENRLKINIIPCGEI